MRCRASNIARLYLAILKSKKILGKEKILKYFFLDIVSTSIIKFLGWGAMIMQLKNSQNKSISSKLFVQITTYIAIGQIYL